MWYEERVCGVRKGCVVWWKGMSGRCGAWWDTVVFWGDVRFARETWRDRHSVLARILQ